MPTQLTSQQFIVYCKLFSLDCNGSISAQDIKKPFKILSLQFHPDRNPDNPQVAEKYKDINVARDALTDHILYFGNTLASTIYDSSQKPNQNVKLLTGFGLSPAAISVPYALDKIIELTPHTSSIQKNLLDAIVNVINQFDINNFKNWKERIIDCRAFIQNAIDGDTEITRSLLFYYDRINSYFDELKLVLDEYNQIDESEKKFISLYKFQDGLEFIQNKLKHAKAIIIENQQTAALTDKSRSPLVRLGNNDRLYDSPIERDDDNLAYKMPQESNSPQLPIKNIPQLRIPLQQFTDMKKDLENRLRSNPIIINNKVPGPHIELLRDLIHLNRDAISCSSDTLNILIADTETAYNDFIHPNCEHPANLKNAIVPILNFLFNAFPTEFKNRKLAIKFSKLLPEIPQLNSDAPPMLSLASTFRPSAPSLRQATPPLRSPQPEPSFWSNFADSCCCFFSCISERKKNPNSDQIINIHADEHEPLIRNRENR